MSRLTRFKTIVTRPATRVREYTYQKMQVSPKIRLEQRNQIVLHMITDPYCPAVRTMASDDTPLVVKINEEFPTTKKEKRIVGTN